MISVTMKQLLGSDLAGYIKERQAGQARSLIQAKGINPKLAIVVSGDNPVIDTYVKLKERYGDDIGILVGVHRVEQSEVIATIEQLNNDESVHGIIMQLPLADKTKTDEVLATISVAKDVDGLAPGTKFDAATPLAIDWLLAGYNINLQSKNICIVGQGRLVGIPLAKIWQQNNYDVHTVDAETTNKDVIIASADVIVTAVGKAGLITGSLVKEGAIVVDAGVASEKGVLKGDVADEVYERDDITITPRKGGVGPLTVTALFENVIRAASVNN